MRTPKPIDPLLAPGHTRPTPPAVRAVALGFTARSVAFSALFHTHVRHAADGVHHIRLVADLAHPSIPSPEASASYNLTTPASLRTATKRASRHIRRLTYMNILEAVWLHVGDESTIKRRDGGEYVQRSTPLSRSVSSRKPMQPLQSSICSNNIKLCDCFNV
jgi:hypothetical protein